MTKLHEGQKVIVKGPPGQVSGTVMDARATKDLPDAIELLGLTKKQTTLLVKSIAAELGVLEVALITHTYAGEEVCFCALLTEKGWQDLRGQALEILKEESSQ